MREGMSNGKAIVHLRVEATLETVVRVEIDLRDYDLWRGQDPDTAEKRREYVEAERDFEPDDLLPSGWRDTADCVEVRVTGTKPLSYGREPRL